MENRGKYIGRRNKKDNPHQRLQDDSLALLQRLSGELWTDFNAHDPGVTTLDVLNNALDELRYKLDFPLPDYLVDPLTGQIPFRRMGLLPFEELLGGSVVTPEDYEELMVGHLPEVDACRAVFSKGCYDFTIHTHGNVDREALLLRAARLYHANRNLCETLGQLRLVEAPPGPTRPPADGAPQREPAHRPRRYKHRDIGAHRTVQWDFPDCYGINRRGVAPGASQQEKARIAQLQAYLLIFDHLLAGAAQQAAMIGQRLSLSGEITPEMWPEVEVDAAQQLIDREKRSLSPQGAADFAWRQRQAWMETLDTLYGERTGGYFTEEPLEKRAVLIRELPERNRQRFRSFDLLDSRSTPTVEHWGAGDGSLLAIEHLLLYPAKKAPDNELGRISLLHPLGGNGGKRLESLRERLPAHITTEIRGVEPRKWDYFEKLYALWRQALAEGRRTSIKNISEEIKRFL